MLTVAFLPQYYMQLIGKILVLINPIHPDTANFTQIVQKTSYISFYSFILVAIVGLIWMIRSLVLKSTNEQSDVTWGCGYVAPSFKQQYTAKSFSKPLGKIFNFLLIEKKQFQEMEKGEIFPAKKSYVSHYHDFFEHNLIDPLTGRYVHSANWFSFIQNGRIQSYVLYGILFILAILILSFFNIVK